MSNRHRESPGSPQISASPPPFATEPIPSYAHHTQNAAFDPAFPRALTTTDLALLGFRRANAASDAPRPPPIHQRAISGLHTSSMTQTLEPERRHTSIPPTLEIAPWTATVQSIEEGSDPYVALQSVADSFCESMYRELGIRVELEDAIREKDELIEEYESHFLNLMRVRDRYRRERNQERVQNRALQAQVQTLTNQLAEAQNPVGQPPVVQAGPIRGGGRGSASGGTRGDTRGRAGRGGRGTAGAPAETRKQPQRKCKVVKR